MTNNFVYWIDDERRPDWFFIDEFFDQTVIWIKDYNMFKYYLNRYGVPVEIHFDHDLGNPCNETGLDCAKLLVQYCMDNCDPLPSYACHSSNPDGRKNILSYLESYEKSLNI